MSEDRAFADLLMQVRAGDKAAATELVRRYEPEVRRFVRYRLTDPRLRRFLDSLDVCQSVFANFFVGLADGRIDVTHPTQLYALLVAMAANKVRDHARRQGTVRRGGNRIPDGEAALVTVPDPARRPDETLEVRDLVDTIRAQMAVEEQTWLDRWMLGLGWSEIAAAVGEQPEALRKRFGRACDRAIRLLGWKEMP